MTSLINTCTQYERAFHYKLRKEKHHPHFFYHVSNVPLKSSDGKPFEKVELEPRLISSSECDIQHIRRICVAPTVEQAINACAQSLHSNKLYIYRTAKKRSYSYIPYGVFDAPITGERWLMSKSQFVLVGHIDTDLRPRNKLLWHALVHKGKSTIIDFDSRGGLCSYITQRNELPRVRKFLHKNKEIFYSDEEHLRNYAQASNKFNKRFIK
jgi:hypothetical protein